MTPTKNVPSIHDYRLSTLFGFSLKEIEERVDCVFSNQEKQTLLRQSVQYPWMQRMITDRSDDLNEESLREIKSLSKKLLLDEEDPEIKHFLNYYLPGESSEEWGGSTARSLVKPTFRAIQAQAKLFEKARSTKRWAEERYVLQTISEGIHDVFPLQEEDFFKSAETYFKVSKLERYMEVMVWDIAVIWGWEDLFTATKLDRVYVHKVLEKVKGVWTIFSVKKTLLGSMQTAIAGTPYEEYKFRELIHPVSIHRAFVAMYLLGLNDLHRNNMIVQRDGTLKLFDNTKCLPPGNQWFFATHDLLGVHRFALFELDACHVPLIGHDIRRMQRMVATCKERFPVIQKYFQSVLVQKMLKKLPAFWLDAEETLTALKQRIKRLEAALAKDQRIPLFELFLELYPEYAFVSLATYIYCRSKYKKFNGSDPLDYHKIHVYVGGKGIFHVFKNLILKGYNLPEIQRLAEHRDMTMTLKILCIIHFPHDLKVHAKSEREKCQAIIEMYDWLEQFRHIPRDHKDDERPEDSFSSRRDLLKSVWSTFVEQQGFANMQEGLGKDLYFIISKLPGVPFLFYCIDEQTTFAVYSNGDIEDTRRRF